MTNLDKLIEKYNAGETSLVEEAYLKENADDLELQAWFNYVNKSKVQAESNLKTDVWKAIDKKRNRFRISVFSAAASFMLLVFFTVDYFKPQQQSLAEKEALLQEAKAMFSDGLLTQNIIYEDELVIIYTEQ